MSTTPKKLINDPATVVPEAVDGALLTDFRLKRVGQLNVLVRHDVEVVRDKCVSVISGGGSGHEPAHAGFVGPGMLTAAVCGNVFASPSVSTILAAIRVCGGTKGVLLVVKNYTGDRLNFGMAMEKAKQEGISCMMVIVDDDCALPRGKGITGGRGVAGTVFVHKVAGAAAAAGLPLADVHAEAAAAMGCVGSLGVALSTCTVPGAPPSQRLAAARMYEVGMGIHGEPGREQRELPETGAATAVADILVEGILGSAAVPARLEVRPGADVAILLNNLGALPAIEMAVVARAVVVNLLRRGLRPLRAFVGPYMTALEMTGVSLTVVRLPGPTEAASLLERLDAPTLAPAWTASSVLDVTSLGEPSSATFLASRSIPYDPDQYGNAASKTTNKSSEGKGVMSRRALAVVRAVCERIIAIEPTITEYDTVCGDGDCGLVMKAGAIRVLADVVEDTTLSQDAGADAAVLCDRLATAISASMGGTSGALLEIFFRAAATYMASPDAAAVAGGTGGEGAAWAEALWRGLEAIKYYGGASVGMRTMLDALEPGLAALRQGLQGAAAAAKAGMESTKTMGSLAGRSNYVEAERMHNVPDPGAAVVAAAFEVAETILA
jgi:dihydroxyacetone kinase